MNRADFFNYLRKQDSGVFGTTLSQEAVTGIEGILDAMIVVGDGRAKTLAYALATAYHETGRRMVPVREGFARTDEAAVKAVALLASKRGANSAPAKYGKPTGPYGKCYYGRGHVQLTWRENYARCSEDAGVDLEKDPDAMLDPVISARILIRGLIDGRWNNGGRGPGIAHYLPDNGPDNLVDARRTVNLTDQWAAIGRYYTAFLRAIDASGGWKTKPADAEKAERALPVAAWEMMPPTPAASRSDSPAILSDTNPSDAELSAWLASCPGDPREIGAWLVRIPRKGSVESDPAKQADPGT